MSNFIRQGCLEVVLKHQAEIPVTIVTGFLGSGKATLLNHLLDHRQGLKVSEAALNQLIFGDIILLNKTDLVTPEVLAELEDYIRWSKTYLRQSIAPNARIINTEHGRVALPLILDVGANSNTLLNLSKSSREHSHHLENDGFVSVLFESDFPLILPKFQNFLDRLAPDVYRAKGIVKFQGSQLCHILQMSGK